MVLSHCPLIIFLFYLPFLGLTVAGQEIFELVHLQAEASANERAIGVSLCVHSSNAITAECWSRAHVLSSYTSNSVTFISVGRGVLCEKGHEHQWDFVLPSIRNLYYSLVRWGMAKEIKVPAAFCSGWLEHLLSFLHDANSACATRKRTGAPAHHNAMGRLGLSRGGHIRTIRGRRKLPFWGPSSVGRTRPAAFQVTPHLARSPSSPSLEFPRPPDDPVHYDKDGELGLAILPVVLAVPTPPCLAPPVPPAPAATERHIAACLWCVRKPTVPAEMLREEIEHGGSCCYPYNICSLCLCILYPLAAC